MNPKIALGFGNNIDYEIKWDSAIFEHFISKYNIQQNELDTHIIINSERDLVVSILAFLQDSSGGERFIVGSTVIEDFSLNFENKVTLGGTPVRAAIVMHKFGYRASQHLVTLNDHVRQLLPPDNPYVCSNSEETSYPHLIVQFGKDTCVRANDIDICASQANRLIYHSDTDNIRMKLNEDFADLMIDADVLLLSGFNAMQDETLLMQRIESLSRMMELLPEDVIVFYEDAGYFISHFSELIYQNLREKIDIFSLNEDELQGYLNRKINLLDASQVIGALDELAVQIPISTIVVHTKHWALAYGDNASRFSKSLRVGTRLATTRYCFGDDFTLQNYQEIDSLSPSEEHMIFAAEIKSRLNDSIVCVPVVQIEQANTTTVGLGDAFVGGFLLALADDFS